MTSNKLYKLFIIFSYILMFNADSYGITLVYSLKVRRVFNISSSLFKQKKKSFIFSAAPVYYTRKRHIINPELRTNLFEKNVSLGSIVNFRYSYDRKGWLELTTGIINEKSKSCGTLNRTFSRTGFDDIILSGGTNFYPNKDFQFTLYGVTGFPSTRKLSTLEIFDTLVGTRLFSLGVGSELSCVFFNHTKRSLALIVQSRFLHFFKRKGLPLLGQETIFQPGNTADLLFALQYQQKKNLIEVGYSPVFFINQAVIRNNQKINVEHSIRHSVYFDINRFVKNLTLINKPGVLVAGYSFAWSARFNTRISVYWGSISVIF